MKVAVSVPDEVYAAADRAAKRLGIARSELYARAIGEYLARMRAAHVTEALDAVYAKRRAAVDPVLHAMQLRSLPREDW